MNRLLSFAFVVGLIPVVSTVFGHPPALGPDQRASATTASTSGSSYRALLNQYCIACHNDRVRTAKLALDASDLGNVGKAPELWEKVIIKLRSGAMPPSGMPRPDSDSYNTFASYLETELDRAAAGDPNPGRTEALHRLNRNEYRNAIRDLLELKIDVAELLPADTADRHGFDNMAGVLGVSPALFSRYVSAAHQISRLAVGLPPIGPVFTRHDVPLDLNQDDQMSDDLPFGSRGGTVVRHYFPVDAEYVIKVRLQTNYTEYIRGLGWRHRIETRLDGAIIKQFTVGGDALGTPAPGPGGFEGNILGDSEWEDYMHHADEGLEVRIFVPAGPHVIGVSFPREHSEPEGIRQPPQFGFALAVNGFQYGNPAVGSVAIYGPYEVVGPGDTPSRRKVFVCRPAQTMDEEACAKRILSTLARRAYRRPVNEIDIGALLVFYKTGRSKGSFEAGIQTALERLLADPQFLFRIERDPVNVKPGTAYRISDLELASRLSFFLWSSIPDDELLNAAARGELSTQRVLEQQVRRMLTDPRSNALVENFVGQWLYLRNLRTVYPDPEVFPEFDGNLREAFQHETELFVGSQISEDRSVLDLLTANYTFVNERLARHYGIPNVYGNRFRRVTFSDAHRGGLLGQGSVLTVTSYPNRTSPVIRGKWLLENILGTPPPPPPPDVPSLPDRAEDGQSLSVRKRMEEHRKSPACAVCHTRMDPLGFSLENFDAVGEWRASERDGPIDATGVLPSGVKFEGLPGLRTVLLLNGGSQFANTVIEKLLTYALGRGVEYYDSPFVRSIGRAAKEQNYSWSSIILAIVKSPPFQMRKSEL